MCLDTRYTLIKSELIKKSADIIVKSKAHGFIIDFPTTKEFESCYVGSVNQHIIADALPLCHKCSLTFPCKTFLTGSNEYQSRREE